MFLRCVVEQRWNDEEPTAVSAHGGIERDVFADLATSLIYSAVPGIFQITRAIDRETTERRLDLYWRFTGVYADLFEPHVMCDGPF